MTTTLTGEMFVGADRVRGAADELHGIDPRTGSVLDPAYGLGTRDDVDRAARLAAEAFPGYRATDHKDRAAFLDQVADNIDALGDELVERVQAETGIVEGRVRGELARTTNQLRLFADVVREGSFTGARIDPALPHRTPLPRPDIRQRKVPLGPVAVFGASNFPLAFSVAGGDTAAAFAAGCPVIVKAHSAHPGTSEMVAGAISLAVQQHGLPAGTFSMIYGSGHEVGIALVTHPAVKAVGFTGSRSGGIALMRAAAERTVPIPVYAEMSSINPVFLLPGALAANPTSLATAYVESLATGVGQLCTNPGLVFAVDGPDLEAFLGATAESVRTRPAQPMLNTGMHASFCEGVSALAAHPDVQHVAEGEADQSLAAGGQAHVFTTTGEAFATDPALHEEVFGASSLVVRVGSTDQLREVASALEGQLTATLHASDVDHDDAAALLPVLEDKVGRIVFNGWPTGVDVGHAMVHGGPFPATSDGRSTSVGTLAIDRFLRPVAYQNAPRGLLPAPVDTANSLGVWRRVDGEPLRA